MIFVPPFFPQKVDVSGSRLPARLGAVLPRPTEACAMPVIFVTVEEALGDLAGLKKGARGLFARRFSSTSCRHHVMPPMEPVSLLAKSCAIPMSSLPRPSQPRQRRQAKGLSIASDRHRVCNCVEQVVFVEVRCLCYASLSALVTARACRIWCVV